MGSDANRGIELLLMQNKAQYQTGTSSTTRQTTKTRNKCLKSQSVIPLRVVVPNKLPKQGTSQTGGSMEPGT